NGELSQSRTDVESAFETGSVELANVDETVGVNTGASGQAGGVDVGIHRIHLGADNQITHSAAFEVADINHFEVVMAVGVRVDDTAGAAHASEPALGVDFNVEDLNALVAHATDIEDTALVVAANIVENDVGFNVEHFRSANFGVEVQGASASTVGHVGDGVAEDTAIGIKDGQGCT